MISIWTSFQAQNASRRHSETPRWLSHSQIIKLCRAALKSRGIKIDSFEKTLRLFLLAFSYSAQPLVEKMRCRAFLMPARAMNKAVRSYASEHTTKKRI